MLVCFLFFFFQAEDGIRDHCVTGVQTCALPICPCTAPGSKDVGAAVALEDRLRRERSEERRVGKSVDLGGRRIIKKKKKKVKCKTEEYKKKKKKRKKKKEKSGKK